MKTLTAIPAIILCLFMSQTALAFEKPWSGDPMIVTAEASDGGNILCTGANCGAILNRLYNETLFDQMLLVNLVGQLLDDDGTTTVLIDRGEFCERLHEGRPSNCSKSSAPSVPNFDGGWQPNGCGVGGWRDAALSLIARFALDDFTGDLDAPFPGVSFLAACNEHDYCYGIQGAKTVCDESFNIHMNAACAATTSGSTLTKCSTMVSAYFLAVSEYGGKAYESAGTDLACARWHVEMTINGCQAG